MIKLFTFAPGHLDLNGDQGNLLILSKRLEWAGVSHAVVELNTIADLRDAQQFISSSGNLGFLLIGHGSMAAMKELEPSLPGLAESLKVFEQSGAPALVLGSFYEALRATSSRQSRRSEFVEITIPAPTFGPAKHPGGFEVELFGYLNSKADLEVAKAEGAVVFTLLHGPVLLKSPQLLGVLLDYFQVQEPSDERIARINGLVAMAKAAALSLD